MKIKNVSDKIISVGSTVLMPDKDMNATKAVCETPAIKALVRAGFLTIAEDVSKTNARSAAIAEAKAKAAAEAKAKAEAEAKAKAEAEAKAKAEAEAKAAAEAAAVNNPENQ